MELVSPFLDSLVELLKGAFDRNSLKQTVKSCLNEDMYKEWVNPNQSLKDDLWELLPKLAQLGLLAILLDRVAQERAHLQESLNELRQLAGIKSTSTEDRTQAITTGVASVANKLQFPAVRAIVSQSRGLLAEIAARISLLGHYKNLHDELHDARMNFRLFQKRTSELAKCPDAVIDFIESVMQLEAVKEDILKIQAELPVNVRAEESAWIERFTSAVALARQAGDEGDPITAKESVQAIRRILVTEPSRIDSHLNSTAEKLNLAELKDIFAAATAVPELADEAATLDAGRVATEQLLRQIQTQVIQHTEWQAMDRAFDSSDEYLKTLADDPSDFDAMWRGLKKVVQPLISAEPDSQWAKRVALNLTTVETTRAALDWPKVTSAFIRFRQDSTTQFLAVDKKLKELAGSVNTLSTPLRNLLATP